MLNVLVTEEKEWTNSVVATCWCIRDLEIWTLVLIEYLARLIRDVSSVLLVGLFLVLLRVCAFYSH